MYKKYFKNKSNNLFPEAIIIIVNKWALCLLKLYVSMKVQINIDVFSRFFLINTVLCVYYEIFQSIGDNEMCICV